MPDHTSVTKHVCGKWVEELGIYLPGKCGSGTFYGAYLGNMYYSDVSAEVNDTSCILPEMTLL